jgi:integrase
MSAWPHAVESIGMTGLRFHDLRHTGNHFAAQSGASLRDLVARMGHDSERASLIYQHQARALTRGSRTRSTRTSRRLVESAGLRRITFYHARHSALSYLLNSGQVPIAVVAAWAGHADGGATALKHYIRVRPGDLEAARDAIAALLGA